MDCTWATLDVYETTRDESLLDVLGFEFGIAGVGLKALPLAIVGYPDQARRSSGEAIRLATERDHLVTHTTMISYEVFDTADLREGMRLLAKLAEESSAVVPPIE